MSSEQTPEPDEIIHHELIGLECRVVKAPDNTTGITGDVVDETSGTLYIESGNIAKQVPKKDRVFEFVLDEKTVRVKGSVIEGRPEDRLKTRQRTVGDN